MKIRSTFVAFSLLWLLATLTVQAQTPVINAISQTYGTVNEVITIQGSGFGNDASQVVVFFGAAASETLVRVSDTEIQALVPAGATTSSLSVVNLVTGLTAYSSELFTLSYDGFEFKRENLEDTVGFATERRGELYNFCVCDFNLDGRNDIVTTNTGNNIRESVDILQNNTTDINSVSFIRPDPSGIEITETRWVRCGDLNGDGMPDLVFSFSNESATKNKIAVYMNTGISGQDINFSASQSATFYTLAGSRAQGARMVIRDLDNDGKPEIVVGDLNNSGQVSIFRNRSTKTEIIFDSNPLRPFDTFDIALGAVDGIDVDDLNEDGLPDLVANTGSKQIHILTNASTPGNILFSSHLTVTTKGNGIKNINLGDMDGDGLADIVVRSSNRLSIFRNTTESSSIAFATEAVFDPSSDYLYRGLDLADLDGNGLLDIVSTNEQVFPKLLRVALNTSTPGSLSFDASSGFSPTNTTRSVRASDFNGDGKPDLAYTDIDNNRIVIQLNRNCIQPVLEPVNGLGVCDVLPYQLNATKGIEITYQWEVSDDGTNFSPLTSAADSTDTYTTTQEHFFRVKVSSSHNGWECEARVSNVVKVIRPEGFVPVRPVIVNPDPATPYCFGEDVVIQAEDINAEFIWTDPQGNVIPGASTHVLTLKSITAAQAGAYTVYVRASPDQGGCVSDIATTTIQVSEPPMIQVGADQPPVLLTSETRIALSFNEPGGHTYSWQKDGQPVVGATASTLTVSEVGTYVATITNSLGCARGSAPFTVAAAQTTIPSTVCLREPADFRISPDSLNTSAVRYRWTFGDGAQEEDDAVSHTYTQAGTYTVVAEVLAADGRTTGRLEQAITVFDLPELTITTEGKRHLCPGETVTLVGNAGFDRYTWSTGETTETLVVTEAGIYSLTVTTHDGCTLTQDIEVNDVPNSEALIRANSERVSLGDTLQLIASGGDTYQWNPATGLSDTTIANPIARPLVTTTYTCVVTTHDGCSVTAEYTVYVDRSLNVEPQRIFSPNGDGRNDTWLIEKMELYPDCRMTLFNRQGVEVFRQEDYTNDNPWNGTGNGRPMPAGVYFYLIDCGDEAGQQTGSVTIVR